MPVIYKAATSVADRRPDAPTLTIESPFGSDAFMSDIIITGEPYFIKNGALIVERGEIEIFRAVPDTEGLNPAQIKVQTSGDVWNRNDHLRFYLWTREPGQGVGISVYLQVELDPTAPTSTVVPPDRILLNELVSTDAKAPNTAIAWLNETKKLIRALPSGEQRTYMQNIADHGFGLHNKDAIRDQMLQYAADFNGDIRLRFEAGASALNALQESLPDPNDETGQLFPARFYAGPERHARLVNMRGNKQIILTMDNTLLTMANTHGGITADSGTAEAPVSFQNYAPRPPVGWQALARQDWELPDVGTPHRVEINMAPPEINFNYPRARFGFSQFVRRDDRFSWYRCWEVRYHADIVYSLIASDTDTFAPDFENTVMQQAAPQLIGTTTRRYIRATSWAKFTATAREIGELVVDRGNLWQGVQPYHPQNSQFPYTTRVPFTFRFGATLTAHSIANARAIIKFQIKDAQDRWTDLTAEFWADYNKRILWTPEPGLYNFPSGPTILRALLYFVDNRTSSPVPTYYSFTNQRGRVITGHHDPQQNPLLTGGADFNASLTLTP